MAENNQGGSGRRVFGDLTNVLGKRPATSDLEMCAGRIKISRVEKALEPNKAFDGNAKASGGATGSEFRHLFDGVAKENFIRPSIFRGTKVQHMAAEAAGLLSKESGDVRDRCTSWDSSRLPADKEHDSSLESEGVCEEEDDDMDSELLAYTRNSSKMTTNDKANDGECLTQEEMVGSSGNQKPLSSLDFTTSDDLPCSNAQNHPLGIGVLEEAGATKSCACSFCLKVAFMWTDLQYQEARGRLAALKKSIKFARSLGSKSQGNGYASNAGKYNSKRAAEVEFDLSQQQRSLFLHTENVLVRESAQLHSSLMKLKEFRENCKTDLEMVTSSSLEK